MTHAIKNGNVLTPLNITSSRVKIAKQVYNGCVGAKHIAITASKKARTANIGMSRECKDRILEMQLPENVRASCFAYYAHAKRKKSLRHFATLTATFNTHFSELGSFEELRKDWRLRHRSCIVHAASSSVPAGSGSLVLPQLQ